MIIGKQNGTTPLMLACEKDLLDIAKLLLDHGAEVNHLSHVGGSHVLIYLPLTQ